MNHTNLNAELLADTRGRKHIPLAVFAVIAIHVILFVVLLIAAGCKSRARARLLLESQAAAAQEQNAPLSTNLSVTAQPAAQPRLVVDRSPAPGSERTAQRALPSGPGEEAARTYVVQPGDTIGKIAKELGSTIEGIRELNQIKRDLIYPGQKLRVPAPPSSRRELASI